MFKKLVWDSTFFEQPVFAFELTSSQDWKRLDQNLNSLKEEQPGAILYLKCPATELTPGMNDLILRTGAVSYGSRVVYCQALPQEQIAPEISCTALEASTPEAVRVAIGSSRHSRFRQDPRLEPYADRLYEKWIQNGFDAVKNGTGAVFAVQVKGETAGILSVSLHDTEAKIELVAVQPAFGRRGIGRALVQRALTFAQEKGCRSISVVTQGENAPAMKLYESCGFVLCEQEYIWHLHL